MRQQLAIAASAVVLVLALTGGASGQVQTGSLTGSVRTADDLLLPGAIVTISSPALQGIRMAITDTNGAYIFRGLLPGVYTVRFEFPDTQPVEEVAVVPLGGTAAVNATMQLAELTAEVTVTGSVPSAVGESTTATNLTLETIDLLPTGRTPFLVAELAPGVTSHTPNNRQVTIAGGFAFDNVFIIDGVDVNDNLFGTAHNLFIEDAVEETAVFTSGIPAEYGRFSGGVINIITKSGGNDFSGSFRQNLTNDAWTKETPFEVSQGRTREDELNTAYEGTFGGPVVRDRAWFFTAGRYTRITDSTPFPETNLPFTSTATNKRYQVKGTITPASSHVIQTSFIDNSTESRQPTFPFSIDPSTVIEPNEPNRLFSAHWTGVVGSKSFATLQMSRKTYSIEGVGGTAANIVDSPFITLTQALAHFNAPYFDATDPEDRHNLQFAGSLAHFVSTPGWGTHDLKVGFDHYTATNTGGNSQSSTGFVFIADYATFPDGRPVISDGRLVPSFVPGQTLVQNWLADRGAEIDVRTLSLYAQDRWAVNRNLNLELGVRYERVRSEATGGIIGVDTDRAMPRVGATYDLRGDGRTVLQATYGHYSGKYAENQVGRNTNVGNPDLLMGIYLGPPGTGRNFTPGFDPANYLTVFGDFPTANVSLADGLKSPVAKEFSIGAGQELGSAGWARVTFTARRWSSFLEDFIDDPSPSGKVTIVRDGINFGTFDRIVWRNSDDATRLYKGLHVQTAYRVGSRLNLGGHWSIQLENDGDFVGEATNQPGIGSDIGDYPEILVRERNVPTGRFDAFQRHNGRLWAIYNQGLGWFGSVDVVPLWRIESGRAYSLRATGVPLSPVQLARNPGYATLPGAGVQTVFFGDRGTERFSGYGLLDLSLNYRIPVWRELRPWLKVEFLNVLNNQKLIQWDTTVIPDANSPLDADGLPTGYIEGPRFGEGTAAAHYPRWRPGQTGGRTFLMAWGMRF